MTKVGQVYRDKDKRMSGGNRHLLVRQVTGLYVYLVRCTSGGAYRAGERRTRIAHATLEKRFELVGEPADA